MTKLRKLWKAAKVGARVWFGPITLHLRLSRTAHVTSKSWRPAISKLAAPIALAALSEGRISELSPAGVALIVGTGPGLGSALARRFARAGMRVAVAARNTEKLADLALQIESSGGVCRRYACDATVERSVVDLIRRICSEMGPPDLVVYNVEHFTPGTILDIETPAFEECWRAMALGGFLVGREAARSMVARATGTIIYTGATGARRGRAEYINMAVGKFGVRALAQSMARDLGPKGIHVAHVILDGGILSPRSPADACARMSSMFPEHIADVYLDLYRQHPSVWTQEMDLRPWVERF